MNHNKTGRIYGLSFTSLLFILSIWSCSKTERQIATAKGVTFPKAHFDDYFVHLMDSLNMPGLSVAIINEAQIVYHEVFGVKIQGTDKPVNKTTFFEAASLSKPLFAFFVMKQVDKGLPDLDQPLYQYLPYPDIEYDERYKNITARMILSHTSGFPNWRADSLRIDFEPGMRYQYSGEGYRYLANVVAQINHLPIEQLDSLFQEEIAQPLGASLYFKWNEKIAQDKATGHVNDQPTDNFEVRADLHFGSAGGLHSEAASFAKFLIALMEKKILSPEAYTELLKQQIKLPENDINSIVMGASGWSLGLGMIPTDSEVCYWHSGNNEDYQSWFHIFPEKRYGIVVFTNSDKIQTPDFFTTFFDFLNDGIAFDRSQLQ